MRRRIIEVYARLLARRRREVLFLCLALTGVSAALIPRLEFRTARSALTSADDPDLVRFEDYLSELGPNAVVLLAQGGTEPERKAFIEDLASALRLEKGEVDDVFYRIPSEWILNRVLGLRSTEDLKSIAEEVEKEKGTLARLTSARGLPALHRVLIERMEEDFKSGRRPEPADISGLRSLRALMLAQKRLIEKPGEAAAALEQLDLFGLLALLRPDDPKTRQLARGGYIASLKGEMYLALIRMRDTSDSPERLVQFLDAIRRAAETARKDRQAIRYGLTGVPVTVVEESQTVRRDAAVCSFFAILGISILATLAFRRKLAVLLILISLGMGILWNIGLTWAIFGGLNLITSSVPVILLALAIDFGIHVVVAYEAARSRGRSPGEALQAALIRVGPGLSTGALTTALAFYAICFMEYRGFQEFGVIAGNGVLLSLLAMVSALPALLVATDRRADRAPESPAAPGSEEPPNGEGQGFLPAAGPRPSSRFRKTWRWACRGVTAFPALSTTAAVAVTIYFFFLAREIGFDYRVEDLLPKDAESSLTQEDLKKDRNLSPQHAVVFAPDRQALKTADERASREEAIERRHSILDLLPEPETSARGEQMARLARLLEPARIDPGRLERVDPAALRKSLEDVGKVFDRAVDLVVNLQGGQEMLRLFGQITDALDKSSEFIAKARPRWASELEVALYEVWAWAAAREKEVKSMLAAGPVEEGEVPKELLEQLKGPRSGRYVLYLYPREDLDERREALESFVQAARRVDPGATGYPIVFFASTSLIHRGFSTAVLAAAAVIFLTLLLDFRRFHLVLLATLPKVIGIIWMLGIMSLLGLNYNLANQIVIPLLIGVGLSYGIHIIHRFFMQKEGERNITNVLEHTGGAIALSGLTTMVGFGSLALANHRGMASMGRVLFFGVGAALIASTFILANILCLIYRPKR